MLKKLLGVVAVLMLLNATTHIIENHKAPAPVDPKIIHVPAAPEEDKRTLADLPPEWHKFNKEDTLIIDRHTNTFFLFEITDEAYIAFEKESNYMAFLGVKDITINLHSPGGSLYAEQLIEAQISILKDRGIHIKTVIDSGNACMSACPLIFLLGDERSAYADSVIMFHAPYIVFPYNVPESMVLAAEKDLRESRDKFGHVLSNVCKLDPAIATDVLDHHEHFYAADVLNTRCGAGFFTQVIPIVKSNPGEIVIPGLNLDDLLRKL